MKAKIRCIARTSLASIWNVGINNQRPNVNTIQRLTQRPPTASEQLCELTRSHSPAGRLFILPAEPPNKVHIGPVISSWTMQFPKQPKQYPEQFCFIPFQEAISQSGIFQQPIYLLFIVIFKHWPAFSVPPWISRHISPASKRHPSYIERSAQGAPFRGAPETAPTTSRHIYAPADGTQTSRQKHYISFFGGAEMFTIVDSLLPWSLVNLSYVLPSKCLVQCNVHFLVVYWSLTSAAFYLYSVWVRNGSL